MVSINPEGGPEPLSRREQRAQAAPRRRRSGPSSGMPSPAPASRVDPAGGGAPSTVLDPVGVRAPGRVRSIRAPRPRHTFGPVSVSLLVGLQLAALVAVLVRMVSTPVHWVLLAMVATATVALVVPTRGGSVGTGVLRRLSFLTRDRVVGRASTESTGAALYPGLVVRSVRDHRGRNLGVAEWEQTATAVVAVSAEPGRPVRHELRHRVPLRAIHERLTAGDIPVEAVTVHMLIPAAGSSTGPVGPWWRGRRDVFVSVRVRPLEAREAIARRGGGRSGLDACLAAVTAAVVAEVRAAGLSADALDLEAVAGVIDLVAAPGARGMGTAGVGVAGMGAAAEATPWTEGRHEVTGPGGAHRSLVATRWRPGASDDQADLFLGLAGDPDADITVAVEVRRPRGAVGARPSGPQSRCG
ncbi:MAG: type VII secretion protein EccE, partial [Candidatus Phosphoribacter baldrii]